MMLEKAERLSGRTGDVANPLRSVQMECSSLVSISSKLEKQT